MSSLTALLNPLRLLRRKASATPANGPARLRLDLLEGRDAVGSSLAWLGLAGAGAGAALLTRGLFAEEQPTARLAVLQPSADRGPRTALTAAVGVGMPLPPPGPIALRGPALRLEPGPADRPEVSADRATEAAAQPDGVEAQEEEGGGRGAALAPGASAQTVGATLDGPATGRTTAGFNLDVGRGSGLPEGGGDAGAWRGELLGNGGRPLGSGQPAGGPSKSPLPPPPVMPPVPHAGAAPLITPGNGIGPGPGGGSGPVLPGDGGPNSGVWAEYRTEDPYETGDPWDLWGLAQLGNVKVRHNLDPGCSCSCTCTPGVPTAGLLDPEPAAEVTYNSADPQPVIQLRWVAEISPGKPYRPFAIVSFHQEVVWDGVSQGTHQYGTAGLHDGQVVTAAIKIDDPGIQTGWHHLQATVTGGDPFGGTVAVGAVDQWVLVDVPQAAGSQGVGWSFAGTDRLVTVAAAGGQPGGVIREYGRGGWHFYADDGSGGYVSPAGDNGTLTKNADNRYTYGTPDGAVWQFNVDGLMTSRASPDGHLTYAYTYTDANGDGHWDDLATRTGPGGDTLTFVYDAGLLTEVENDGEVYAFGYDAAGDLKTITNPDGGVDAFSYDANHHLVSQQLGGVTQAWTYDGFGLAATWTVGGVATTTVQSANSRGEGALWVGTVTAQLTDAMARTTTEVRDLQGRLLGAQAADGGVEVWTRDAATTWATAYTDQLGRTTQFINDAAGYVTQVTLPDGATKGYTYQIGHHGLTSETDERGYTTAYTLTADGHVATETDALNQTWTYGWTDGLNTSVTDPLGRTSTAVYDAHRMQTQATDALGHTTTNVYDGHLLQSTTDALGRTTAYAYDSMGRMVSETDSLGNVWQWVYDAAGLLTSETDPRGVETTYQHDARGLVTSATQAAGTVLARTWTASYNLAGDLTGMTDPAGRTWATGYDAAGRQNAVTDPTGHTDQTWYDLAGQVVATQDVLGAVTQYAYNSRGWVTAATEAAGTALARTWTAQYDASGHLTAVTDPLGQTASATFDSLGRVTAVTEAVGTPLARTWTVGYDAVGNATSQTDPLGHTVTVGYDALNRAVSSTDPLGHTWTVAYDAVGNVTSQSDPLGHTWTATYDALDRQVTVTNPLNQTAGVTYDARGNVTQVTDFAGRVTQMAYDQLNRATAVTEGVGTALARTWTAAYNGADDVTGLTDPLGHTWTIGYDDHDRQTSYTDPLGHTWSLGYDAAGNATSQTDPLGHTWTATYDLLGRVTAVSDPLGDTSTATYDALDHVTGVTDAMGNQSTASYDALGRLTAVVHAGQTVSSATYDAADNLTAVTDGNGHTTTLSYDAAGRLVGQTDPLGHSWTLGYDAAGNVTSATDPLGHVWTQGYDALDRVVMQGAPDGGTWTRTYAANGQVASVTDPLNHTTHFYYDALGRQVQTVNPLGATTTAGYDLNDHRVSVTDPVGNVTGLAYDAAGRLVSQTDPAGQTTTYERDAANRLTGVTDRDGRRREYAYDAANRRSSETWVAPGGGVVDTRTFAHDANGNLVYAANSTGAYTFTYDAFNRISSSTDPFGLTLNYQYDGVGQVVQRTDSLGGTETSTYDAANRLVERALTSTQGTQRVDWTYTAANQIATETRYGGSGGTDLVGSTVRDYDLVGRPTSIVHRNAAGQAFATYGLSWDVAGRLTSETDNGSQVNFGYDNANQLTSVSGARAETYQYDLAGNRTGPGYVYGPGNRLLSDGVWNYTYDNEGNLTGKARVGGSETWTYGYDFQNHLTSATLANGGTVAMQASYQYDVLGKRAQKTVTTYAEGEGTTTTERYASDGRQLWADLDGAGTLTARYLDGQGMDQHLARVTAAEVEAWYWADHLGTVRDVTGGTGVVQDHITYDSFGNILGETQPGTGGRYRFTGREWDAETGLYHYRDRAFDAATGRFTSLDRKGFAAGDANLYRYTFNQPNRFTDPSGQDVILPNDPQGLANLIAQLQQLTGIQFYQGDLGGGEALLYVKLEDRGKLVAFMNAHWKEFNEFERQFYLALISTRTNLRITPGRPTRFGGLDVCKDKAEAIVKRRMDIEGWRNARWKDATAAERFKEILLRAGDRLGPDFLAKVEAMFTKEAMAQMAAFFMVYAASHYVGVGFLADGVFAVMMGLNGLETVPEFVELFYAILYGETDAELDQAAAAASRLGSDKLVNILTQILIKAAGKATSRVMEEINCFVAGTPVATEGGLKPIEAVVAGERVWAYNFRTGEWCLRAVERTLARPYQGQLVTVGVAGDAVTATADHPFWVEAGVELEARPRPADVPMREAEQEGRAGRWVDARHLRIGDVLVTRGGGWMEVSNLAIRCAEETVYNLQVSESRNYLVGIIQALVHNRKKEGHILDWELRGPRGGKLECGEEFSGAERTFPKGTKLTFPQQSWYSHTEGKVIADLYYEGKLRPGRQLRLEGTLPPCAACQSICKWASEQFKMEIMYYDGVQGLFWVWKDGELRRR